ncbi:DUF6650 family protein [Streptomyces sp. NPDC050439]|uniref:DUF6650 family protein n=1 Tax=unclassified Streptomyces TaxID=2593676 RepID=UPI0034371561
MGIRGTAFSALGIGANWEFTKSDKLIAQQVMDFLADRRVLTIGSGRPENEAASCLASAAQCRQRLSEFLEQIHKPKSDLRTWLRALRSAFTDFIETGGHDGRRFTDDADGYEVFNQALIDLREQVRRETTAVSARYKLTGLDLPAGNQRRDE